jgi:hypothetical protein
MSDMHTYRGHSVTQLIGSAIAQAVSRRRPNAAARVQTRVWSCRILWWTKVALGQIFSENFGFPWKSTFHLLLHNHLHYLHYHQRLAQYARSGRSVNSLTNQIKKSSWLRHCATSRKVAGSIPDEAIGLFNWPSPSSLIMASNRNEYRDSFWG